MPALSTDLLCKVSPNTGWQLDASGISDASVTTFGLISATGLPTATAVILTVDRVNSSGVATPTKMERIKGIVSGSSVISCVRGFEGTAQAHAAGAVVEIVISAGLWNSLIDENLVEHNQDGSHKGAAVATPIHAASSKATPVDADEIGILDSAASFVLSKLTWANLKATLLTYFYTIFPGKDGWMPVSDAWSYASASTITVPSGAASLFAKGDKIKLTQTTVKYFYIIGVADTVLTVTGGSDYAVANAAISEISVSHASSPIGFPNKFAYTPTYTGFSANPTQVCSFSISGTVLTLSINTSANGTSNTNAFTLTLPVTSVVGGSVYATVTDNWSNLSGRAVLAFGGGTTLTFYVAVVTVFTTSGAKGADTIISYVI